MQSFLIASQQSNRARANLQPRFLRRTVRRQAAPSAVCPCLLRSALPPLWLPTVRIAYPAQTRTEAYLTHC